MEITEVRVQRVSPGNSLKAYANITFDDCFVLHNVRVIERVMTVCTLECPAGS